MSTYRIRQDALKDPAESLNVVIDCFDLCARRWKDNELYSVGESIRPRVASGISLIVITGGTSGAREPSWPIPIGSNTTDGPTLVWQTQQAASNGLNPITSPTCVSDPAGLNIINVTVNEDYKINATYQGGTVDKDYAAVYSFTLDGVTRIARQTVKVRKR